MPRRPLPGSRKWRERRRAERASRWIWGGLAVLLALLAAVVVVVVSRP